MFWYSKGKPKLFNQNVFFLSHEPKCRQKLASPIGGENSQKIAYWYKTYTRQKKRERKVLVGCKHQHHSVYLTVKAGGFKN